MPDAGSQITVFRPRIFVADVGTVLPAMSLAINGTWPTGWKRVPHTEEGAVITPSAPKDDIPSDEAGGSIAVVPAGGAEINISFTLLTPDLDMFSWLSSFSKVAYGVANEVVTLDLTGSPNASAAASVTMTLNGVVSAGIAIASGDNAATAAGKIRAATFSGWTTGGSGAVVTFTKTAVGASTGAHSFQPTTTGLVAATGSPSVTQGSAPAYSKLALAPEGRQFMVGIEGEVRPGGLLANGGMVRAFGYKVEQTDEVEINMRRTGEASALRIAANVRCLNTTVTAAQLLGTGIVGPDQRFNMFAVETAV